MRDFVRRQRRPWRLRRSVARCDARIGKRGDPSWHSLAECASIFNAFVDFWWSVFKWSLALAVLAALVAAPYLYTRVDEEVRRQVEAKIGAHYKTLAVRVRHAQLLEGQGIEVRGLSISQPGVVGPQAELAYIDEALLTCTTDLDKLIQGQIAISHVRIRRPIFRATRLTDGSWSTGRLMPWPSFGPKTPTGSIENATFELVDPQKNPASMLTIRDINLSWKPLHVPEAPQTKRLEIRAQLAADHVQRVEFSGMFEPATKRLFLQGQASGLDISPELRTSLPADLAEQLAPFGNLRAEAQINFSVMHDAAAQPPLKFDVTAQLIRGRIDDPRLPYPLNDLRATVHCTHEGFSVDELTARNGSASLRLTCRGSGYTADSPLALEIAGEKLRLEDQLVNSLPESLREHWYRYLPQGEIDVDVKLAYDGIKWTPDAIIRCRDASFTYYKFPYRLNQGSGTISYANNKLLLRLTAYSGSQPVRFDGEIFNPGPNFTGSVVVEGDNIVFDEKLVNAMPAKCRDVLRQLTPQGTFNFYTRHWRDDPQRPGVHQHLLVAVNRASLNYAKFPYPLGNIRGAVEMLDGQWTFRNLEGTNDTGFVTCQGDLTTTPDGPQLTLHFTGQKVPLEEELRDALPPNMQRLWNTLQPLGEVDLTTTVQYWSHLKRMGVVVDLAPRGDTASITPVPFPYRMERLKGAIHYENGHADLSKLEAVHGPTTMTGGGSCDFQPDGSWQLHLENCTVDRLQTDRELITALPEMLRKAANELKPTGAINLRGSVDFSRSEQADSPLKTQWDLAVDVHQGTLNVGVPLENIYGGARLTGTSEAGKFAMRGELALDSLTYKNFQLTEVLGPMWVDNNRVLLGSWAEARVPGKTPRRISGKLLNGSLLGDFQSSLGGVPRYLLRASINEADLGQFARLHLSGRQKLEGKVQGQVELQGVGRGTNAMSGAGQLRIYDADIYELPQMVSMLKILSVRPPDSTGFTKSDIDFRIQGENILLDRINFNGDAISLIGQGHIRPDRQVNLTFHAMVGRDEFQVPILRGVLGEASQQIMQIHIEGPLESPSLRKEAFPGVNQALQQLQADLQGNRPQTPAQPPPPPARSSWIPGLKR